jgi:putative tricarboxylic transport membrane protein
VKKQLNQEHLIGVVCLLIATVILLITPSFPRGQANINITGPAFFPNLLSLILILCGIYEIGLGFVQEEGRLDVNPRHLWQTLKTPQVVNVFLIVGLLLFFILFFERLGFVVCTSVVLFILMHRLGVTLLKNVLYTIGFVITILLIFGRLFSISLPSGVLEYIGL